MQYLLKYESFSSINLTRNFIIDAFFILKEEFNIEYGVAELLEGSAYLVRIRMDKVIFTKENPTEEKFKTDFNSICERLSKLGLIIIKDNDSPNRGDRINKQFNFIVINNELNKKICPTNNWLSVDISEYENLNFENCAIDQVKNRIRIKKSIVDSSIVNLDAYNLSGVYYKNVNNFDLFWFYKNHSSSIKIINTDFNKSEIYYLISIDCRYNTITLCSNLYEDGFTILNLGQGILNRFIYNAYKYLGIDDVSKICECVLETFSHNRSPSKEFYITN